MIEFNVANAATMMDDSELAASVAAMRTEQERRAFAKQYGDANERAVRLARERHERLYGRGHDGSLSTF